VELPWCDGENNGSLAWMSFYQVLLLYLSWFWCLSEQLIGKKQVKGNRELRMVRDQ
jgi:hypothetical protein